MPLVPPHSGEGGSPIRTALPYHDIGSAYLRGVATRAFAVAFIASLMTASPHNALAEAGSGGGGAGGIRFGFGVGINRGVGAGGGQGVA